MPEQMNDHYREPKNVQPLTSCFSDDAKIVDSEKCERRDDESTDFSCALYRVFFW